MLGQGKITHEMALSIQNKEDILKTDEIATVSTLEQRLVNNMKINRYNLPQNDQKKKTNKVDRSPSKVAESIRDKPSV